MQAQGFGRKGAASGAAAYVPQRPAPMARPAEDPYAAMRADFIAQERAGSDQVSTLAWDTPTSGRSWYKSRLIAYLLWFFLGAFAAHRLYCARYLSAVLQSVMGIVAIALIVIAPHSQSVWGPVFLAYGLWRLVDLFLIPGMCRTPPATY